MKRLWKAILSTAVSCCLMGGLALFTACGESAYDIAVKNGFEGTEQEWLQSLQGKDGVNGKDGKDGADGKDGVNGQNGKDGKDGVDGKDGADGKDGEDGVDGKDGADGKDGKDGAQWFTGTTAPAATLGKVGDFYLNSSTGSLYMKTGSGWTLQTNIKGANGQNGANGTNGKDGSTWFVGTGDPAQSSAVTGAKAGDYYLDTSTGTFYQRGASSWEQKGVLTAAGQSALDEVTVTFDARTSAGAKFALADIQGQDQKNQDKWSYDGQFITYKVTKGEVIENLPSPTLDHCAFLGWYTGSGVNDAQVTNVTPITRNMKLTARYEFNDTARVLSMAKGGAEIADKANEKLVWVTGLNVTDYKADYNFKVIAAETDNIEIYVKRANATPVKWGGNNTAGTVVASDWNAGVYDITIKDGYFTSSTPVNATNFEKYLDGSNTNQNVYTVMVVKNGDAANPLSTFTVHFENAENADLSTPGTEQGKLADLTGGHGANWSEIQNDQVLTEQFIISHSALEVGKQPTITMKVKYWMNDNKKSADEKSYVYTVNEDGHTFNCNQDEGWTNSDVGPVNKDPLAGYFKITEMNVTKDFLEFTVEGGGYTIEKSDGNVYHHAISFVYELDDAKLDVLGNKAGEQFNESELTTIDAKAMRLISTTPNNLATSFRAGAPTNFNFLIDLVSSRLSDHDITINLLSNVYFMIDNVGFEVPTDGTALTVNKDDFAMTVQLKNNTSSGKEQVMLSVTEFKFITEGTKTIELHFTYQGVERVWSITRYVSPADALRNASELLLEAWEMFLKEGGYLNGTRAPYTLKTDNAQVANNSGVQKLVALINQMYAGSLDYNGTEIQEMYKAGLISSNGSSILGTDGIGGKLFDNPGILKLLGQSSFEEGKVTEYNGFAEAVITKLQTKYTSGTHVPSKQALYTFFATSILPHFDASQWGNMLKLGTYWIFSGFKNWTKMDEDNTAYSCASAFLYCFGTPKVAANFVELAFEKYGAANAADFYDGIQGAADDAQDMTEEERAAYKAFTAAHEALHLAGGLDKASETIVNEFMEKLNALCKLYAARKISV